MEKMGVGLYSVAVKLLEFRQRRRFGFMRVGGKIFINKKVPDLLPALPGVERFVLGVTNSPKFLIKIGRLRAITIADQLHDTFALIDLLPKEAAQVAAFGAEDVLPDRLITEKGQRVSHQLPGAAQFSTDGGNKNGWTGCHRDRDA